VQYVLKDIHHALVLQLVGWLVRCLCLCFCVFNLLTMDIELGKDPTFDAPLANVTANVGETALLPCAIDYLGKYKVKMSVNLAGYWCD